MIKTKRRGLKAGLALTVVTMLLLSFMPGGPMPVNRVEAYGENEDETLFYAETWLYDYKYDREVQSNFAYNNDNQIAYQLKGGDQHVMTQKQCSDMHNGDRWMTGLQVPYELLNRRISAYYSNLNGSTPALYFGNFLGTATNLDEQRGDGEGQTPWQYTYIPDQAGNKYYYDAYSHYWQSANNAPKNNNGNVAVQGLVDRTLKNGNLTQNNGTIELPQFSDSFINANSDFVKKYSTGEGFPFNIIHNADGTKTYEFDSAYDAPRYYQNGEIKIGTIDNNGVANWRSDGKNVTAGGYGFFPFNTSSIKNTEVGRYNVNYGFGMKVNIPFNLSENGTIYDRNGNEVDVHFNFSGDDDVWVFIDGVLLLDIGGDHAKVSGDINFTRNSQQIYVSQAAAFKSSLNRKLKIEGEEAQDPQFSTIKNMFQAAGVAFNEDNFYNPLTEHTLTVFYMERGMFESNLSISFNFAPINHHQLTVGEQTEFNRVNPALVSQTKTVADKDVFNYTIQNQNTKSSDVANSGIRFPAFDNINRVNTEAAGNPSTVLASSDQIIKTPASSETHHYVYLKANGNINWRDGSARMAAYFFNSSGGSKWVDPENIGNGVYRFEVPEGYNKVIFTRMKPSGENDWENCWNQTPDLVISSGSYFCTPTGWESSVEKVGTANFGTNGSYPYSVTTQYPAIPYTFGELFTGGTQMAPLKQVAYDLTDPFASKDLTGITNNNGEFKLFYGEYANFRSQFSKDSTMNVVQDGSLYAADAALDTTTVTNANRYHNHTYTTASDRDGSRQVSEYYDSFVYTVDMNDQENRIEEYQQNQMRGIPYQFDNNNAARKDSIHLKQTFVNVVKVGDIVISKDLVNSGETNEQFTFDVTLSELYGDQSVRSVDISQLEYLVFPEGTTDYYGTNPISAGRAADGIKITEKQIAVIRAIPVGTKYSVTESSSSDYEIQTQNGMSGYITEGTYSYSPDGDITGTIIHNTAQSRNTPTVVNKRKTGSLKISKTITGDGADKSEKFSVTVSFNAPSGVDLGSYINRNTVVFGSTATTGTSLDLSLNLPRVTFEVTDGTVVTFTQIPYGTTYVVNENAGDYQSVISYGDQNKSIDSSGDTDTVSITNTKTLPDVAAIVIKKIDNYNNAVTGAEFRLYQTQADANTAFNTVKNHGSVSNGTAPSKNTNGDVFTFENLTPNTTYYIVETVVPEGYQGMTRYLTVTTGAKQTTVTKTAENPKIEIVMPETGGTPFLIDFSMIGVFAVGLAAAALIIYKRKLQSEAVYTDEKGRYKS